MPIKPPSPQTTDEKLDQIISYLERMNRRDRLRTIGGFIRGALGLIPLAIVLFLTWYGIKYGDQLLQKITSMAAEQAGRVAKQNTLNDFLKEFNDLNVKLKK
jgi:predicted PurR-regulated permease PerM